MSKTPLIVALFVVTAPSCVQARRAAPADSALLTASPSVPSHPGEDSEAKNPDRLAYRGYFAHQPFTVNPYASNAKSWADLTGALGAPVTDLNQWTERRQTLLQAMQSILGAMPQRPAAPSATILDEKPMNGYRQIHFELDNGVGARIPGFLLMPNGPGKKPLIHYMHYDGGEYDTGKQEILHKGWPVAGSTGEHLAQRGYALMAIDAYAFGERQRKVPGQPQVHGLDERDFYERSMRSVGQSLWGMMMRDDQIALDWVTSRGDIDSTKIAAMGMSMGAKRAFWMAAMDERIKLVIAIAALPAFQEGVAALVAPRPFLTLCGDKDEYTPAEDFVQVNQTLSHLYELYGIPEQHHRVTYPNLKHDFTLAMWVESLNWLKTWMPATAPADLH